MRKLAVLAILSLSGCASHALQPAETHSGHLRKGMDYRAYEQARLYGELGPEVSAPGTAGAARAIDTNAAAPEEEKKAVISSDELSAAGLGGGREVSGSEPLNAMAPLSGPPSTERSSNAAPRSSAGRQGISDEQNFEAVSARETIETDAERIARQAAAYKVIGPKPVPSRSDAGVANIVAYAISTRNAVGQKAYGRGIFSHVGRLRQPCRNYASEDLAQEAFLERGGPGNDRLGLDPDGDGFACGWDPEPFRKMQG